MPPDVDGPPNPNDAPLPTGLAAAPLTPTPELMPSPDVDVDDETTDGAASDAGALVPAVSSGCQSTSGSTVSLLALALLLVRRRKPAPAVNRGAAPGPRLA